MVDELFELEQPTSVKAIDRARQGPENFLLRALDFVDLIKCLRVCASTSGGVDALGGTGVAVVRLVSPSHRGVARNCNYRVHLRVRKWLPSAVGYAK